MRFKMLSGDVNWRVYGGKFVSKRLNNGDWDYWLVLEVINMWDACGDKDDQPQYYVTISAVSPQAAGPENVDQAIGSCGFSDDTDTSNPLLQVEALSDYGISALLWQEQGNNIARLLREAHMETRKIDMLFGIYMDGPKNGIGQNGWDLISGQDIRAFLASR